MAMINCLECNADISDTVVKCPYCGYKLVKKASKFSIVIVVLIASIILFSYLTNKDEAPITKANQTNYENSPLELDSNAYLDDFFINNNFTPLIEVVKIIQNNGNRCDSVTTARNSIYDGSIVISCNNLKYEYEIKDIGGKLSFKVIR